MASRLQQMLIRMRTLHVPRELQRERKAKEWVWREEIFSCDGGSEVVSRVRRGVLSLRVVRQMLS